jgi:GNAT superfamily N-acetyltransferase
MPPKPLQPDGCFGYLSSMYVMPDHRRRGLAGRLTRAVVDCAHELGLTWVMLHASPAGRQIYEAAGFTEFDEMGLHVPTAVAGGDAGS